MKHTYTYGLLISLAFLASCAHKTSHPQIHSKETAQIHSKETAMMEESTEQSTPSPKASWLHTASEAGIYRTGNPYKVNGVWHFPQKELDHKHDEIGEATWYGHDYHNKMTANGEIFDMHGFTAAHKTLPLPSVVRVTNLSNKKSVILRVNDRGPFDNKRVIDVSKKAAEILGFVDQGNAKVRVQVLPEESLHVASMAKGTSYNPQKTLTTPSGEVTMSPLPVAAPPMSVGPVGTPPSPQMMTAEITPEDTALEPPSAEVLESILPQPTIEMATPSEPTIVPSTPISPVPAKGPYIQAGAYRSKTNAENALKKLSKIAPAHLSEPVEGQSSLYRVRVGPFPHKEAARQKLKAVVSAGHPDATIIG
jgi:rare lipoprotein A